MTNPSAPQGPDDRQPWSQQAGQQQWSEQTGQQQWSQQTPQQPGVNQPGRPASGRGGSGRMVAGVVIGLVTALVLGAVLVLTDVISLGSDSEKADAPVDGAAIELPAELAGLKDRADVVAAKSPERGDEERKRLESSYALTTEWYQRAFDGAGLGVRLYSDAELTFFPTVIAVRAASPGLFTGPITDPATVKLAAGPFLYNRIVEGDVECVGSNTQAVKEGDEPDPEEQLATVCRRADDALTIYVHGPGRGPAGQKAMIELTNAAYEAVKDGAA